MQDWVNAYVFPRNGNVLVKALMEKIYDIPMVKNGIHKCVTQKEMKVWGDMRSAHWQKQENLVVVLRKKTFTI